MSEHDTNQPEEIVSPPGLENLTSAELDNLKANPRFHELVSTVKRRAAVKEQDSEKLEEVDPPASALPRGWPLVKTAESISEEENRSAVGEAEPSDEETSSLLANGSTVRALARSANKNPHQREIVTQRADQITLRKLHWLWPERIPLGKVTVFAGLPGQGKASPLWTLQQG